MRKFFSGLLLLVLFSSGSAFAASILSIGESTMIKASDPSEKVYVDYIVSDYSLMSFDSNFNFSTTTFPSDPWFPSGVVGTQTAYENSQYFYYYQLENNSVANLDVLTLFLDPLFITSTGYISGADLDNVATFNHNIGNSGLATDHENDSATIYDSTSADYDTFDGTPNQSWNFVPPIQNGYESCVLFVTSSRGPIISDIIVQNGGQFDGEAPTPPRPEDTIPEPFSMILLGSGLVGLLIKRRK